MKKTFLLTAGFTFIGLIFFSGIANAAFQVRNTGQIDYYSNVLMAYRYIASDTADIRVLYGPKMYLAKSVKNEVTGESSPDMVLCGRGDTITITLYAANNVSGADTAAWHVYVTDTFALFMQVGAGQNASCGPDTGDSFVYVVGSETAAVLDGPDGFVKPDSISYYTGATRAGGWTNGTWSAWQAYDSKSEPQGVQGIRWYWRYVPSKLDSYGNPTNLPYNIRVQFRIKKNDN